MVVLAGVWDIGVNGVPATQACGPNGVTAYGRGVATRGALPRFLRRPAEPDYGGQVAADLKKALGFILQVFLSQARCGVIRS